MIHYHSIAVSQEVRTEWETRMTNTNHGSLSLLRSTFLKGMLVNGDEGWERVFSPGWRKGWEKKDANGVEKFARGKWGITWERETDESYGRVLWCSFERKEKSFEGKNGKKKSVAVGAAFSHWLSLLSVMTEMRGWLEERTNWRRKVEIRRFM